MANYSLSSTTADGSGAWTVGNGPPPLSSVAVASLPSAASSTGRQFLVTDSNATAILGLGLAVVGSGANIVKVWSNGTSWIIG